MVVKRSNACPFDLFLGLCFFRFLRSLYDHDDAPARRLRRLRLSAFDDGDDDHCVLYVLRMLYMVNAARSERSKEASDSALIFRMERGGKKRRSDLPPFGTTPCVSTQTTCTRASAGNKSVS